MAKALTAKSLQNLKPSSARQEIADGLVRGLYIVLQPSGRASWALRYRSRGRTRKLTLGGHPVLSLREARDLASQALLEVAKGRDPARQAVGERTEQSSPRQEDTVESVAERFVERHAKANAARSWQETQRILRREVIAAWRGRPLANLRRADVHALLDGIVDRGTPIMANRTLAALRRMCGWAVERDIISTSPCAGVRAPTAERSRDRVLSDPELALIWEAASELGFPFGPLTQILILTGQRRDEVGGMRWSEVNLDTGVWVLPRARTKNGREHVVALAPATKAILAGLPRINGCDAATDYVFTTNGRTPVSGFSKAKRMIDSKLVADGPVPAWTLHDLRRTFASGCARLGVSVVVVEKVLNHISGSLRGIVGVYQRHTFEQERRDALEKWAAYVTGNVCKRAAST